MRLGTGILLLALGAILRFAVHVRVSGVDLATIGVILMVVGALGIVLELAVFAPRQRRTTSVTSREGAPTVQRTTVDRY